MVVFAVPNQLEDILHCSIMSDVIATGLRKLFTVVDYDALLKEVSIDCQIPFHHYFILFHS